MKILYVHAPGDPNSLGGIGTYGREVIAGMRARGHEVAEAPMVVEELMGGLRTIDRVPTPTYWNRSFFWRTSFYLDYRFHRAAQRRVRALAASFRPDLIHAFHVYDVGALAATRLPSVVTCHGLEIVDNAVVRTSLKLATAVHCNSGFTRGLVEKVAGPLPKCRVVTWGVRPLAVNGVKDKEFDLVTVGRVVPRKNIATVLRAMAGLPRLRYAIAGEGPEVEPLKRLATELGVDATFLGAVSEEAKFDLIRRSRLFVMCPRNDKPEDVEGLGLVYYEAHAVGVPVLAARSGGVPEAVGDAGLLVDSPLDVEQVRGAIARALEPATYAEITERVKARQRDASWDYFMGAFESLYEQALRTAGR